MSVKVLVLTVLALTALCCATCIGAVIDAGTHGPYSRWYNERKQQQATAAGLIGRPAADVEGVLGRASRTAFGEDGGVDFYYYYPVPMLPASWVEVYCSEGTVQVIMLMRDVDF